MKRMGFIIILSCFLISISANVHTSYLWHLDQPIYWADKSTWNTYQYQKVWESDYKKNHGGNIYSDGQAHPLNNLPDIFGNADRVAAYQYRMRDAISSIGSLPEAGAQVSISGCLMENINDLATAGQWGYYSGWNNSYAQARGWTTTGGKPRMDVLAFTMDHALSPLVDESCLKKQIEAHKYLYTQLFGSTPVYSKGYWPAECAFSERIIKVLVQEGIQWSVIANSHLARTLNDYPVNYGTSGCNIDPPNKADKVATNGTHWWNGQIDGRGGTFAAPYCYQVHKAKYVDPDNGQEYKISVVPMDDLLSYQNGYSSMGTGDIDTKIAPYDNPAQPSIVLMAHDGDNAWGGGYSYYGESVPGFANAAAAQGYTPSTVEQFILNHPTPDTDIVHVEDGAWVNAANDWGHPQFINWIWPMYNASKVFDPTGWTEDARNWAVLTAAQNRVDMAEQLTGTLNIAKIVSPDAAANNAERAWHYFLPAFNSGYMYYGTAIDMEVKPTLAANNATEYANYVINAHPGVDNTPPTVFIPQRFPYNPGGKGFGPIYGYQEHQNSSDFHVWTFAYDASGLQTITLKYRTDSDGSNPESDNANDTYAGGAGVGGWTSLPMTERVFPTGNVTNNSEINFFILPTYIANEYYAQITGLTDVLVDYYVEATDTHGNIRKSPIQHVYVGTGGGTTPTTSVTYTPTNPVAGQSMTVTYGNAGTLYSAAQLKIHLGQNTWQGVTDYNMTLFPAENCWKYTFTVPTDATQVDFVFTDGLNHWDNNSGADWHITVTGAVTGYVIDGTLDASAQLVGQSGTLKLYTAKQGNILYVATTPAASTTDVFMFICKSKTTMVASPWAKAGQVNQWELFTANEGTNGYNTWTDQNGSATLARGTVLEGKFNVLTECGSVDTLYLAVGEYGTSDTGTLIRQVPLGNGDGNINFNEYFTWALNPIPNPPTNLMISKAGNDIQLSWSATNLPDYAYKILYADAPYTPIASYHYLATTSATTYIHTNGVNWSDRLFYRVIAVPITRNTMKHYNR